MFIAALLEAAIPPHDPLQALRELRKRREDIWIIHYSCEDFRDPTDKRPAVTAIVVNDYVSGQTVRTFSRTDYDDEEQLLTDFMIFLEQNQQKLWVHWNMRDGVFGFEALRLRYEHLTGGPASFPALRTFDLDQILKTRHGPGYVARPKLEAFGKPKLQALAELNGISTEGFLDGAEEARLHKERQFLPILYSTTRKVQIIHDVLREALLDRLKTNESSLAVIVRRVEENLLYRVLVIASVIASAAGLLMLMM